MRLCCSLFFNFFHNLFNEIYTGFLELYVVDFVYLVWRSCAAFRNLKKSVSWLCVELLRIHSKNSCFIILKIFVSQIILFYWVQCLKFIKIKNYFLLIIFIKQKLNKVFLNHQCFIWSNYHFLHYLQWEHGCFVFYNCNKLFFLELENQQVKTLVLKWKKNPKLSFGICVN